MSLPFLLFLLAGCATKQDVLRVEEKVGQMRNDQMILKARIDHIDSLVTYGSESDNRLRAEIRTALEELGTQMGRMENQVNDLQQLVYQSSQGVKAPVSLPPPVSPAADSGKADTKADTSVAPTVDCRRLWDNAFKDMRRGQYDLAIAGFTDYLKYCPRGDMSDNSQYWIAESYYEMKQYERAIEEYNRLLTEYADSEKLAAAYFKLGRCYEEKGDRKKALEYFLILKDQYPGTVEYEQVKAKIESWEKESND